MSTTGKKSKKAEAKPEVPKVDAKPEVAKAEAKPEVAKADVAKPEVAKAEPKAEAKPEGAKAKAKAPKKKEAGKPKEPKAKDAKPKEAKPKATKAKAVAPKPQEGSSAEVAKPVAGESGLVDADVANQDPKKRYFKCVYNNETYGRLCGLKPKQAANKAFTSLLKHMKKSGNAYTGGKIVFTIVECTRGSKHGKYCYEGERKSLKDPVAVPIKITDPEGKQHEKVVTYYNKNFVKKIPKAKLEVPKAKAE